jgi:hypothetical protein
MADDQTFEMFHTEELTSSALFISQQEFGWPMNLDNLVMNSFLSIEFLHQSTKEAEDEASVRIFDGNPELLTLYDAAQGPLESANIYPSNPGAIETSSSTLTGYLSSTEEFFKEVPPKKEVEVVTENKKPKLKTKRYKIIPNKFIGNTFPARNVPLSDWWVGNILQSALGGAERGKMWPCDFNSKGNIWASRIPKGRAYKQLGGNDQKWYYVVVCYRYQLHGEEGREAGLIAWKRTASSITSTKKTFKRGGIAMLQNNDWIPDVAGPDEFQELKTDDCMIEAKNKDNTSLDSSKKTFKRTS